MIIEFGGRPSAADHVRALSSTVTPAARSWSRTRSAPSQSRAFRSLLRSAISRSTAAMPATTPGGDGPEKHVQIVEMAAQPEEVIESIEIDDSYDEAEQEEVLEQEEVFACDDCNAVIVLPQRFRNAMRACSE